jgi:hypothetical protein
MNNKISVLLVVVSAFATVEGCARINLTSRQRPGRELCKLMNEDIHESSGLAYSVSEKDILWTHNDSGDSPRIFAFDLDGRDLGAFEINGADAVDWEDMASFAMEGRGYLLIADVGDNYRGREFVTLYLVREPDVERDHENAGRVIDVEQRIDFTYEDGPRDCESVAVDPATRTVFLVSKSKRKKCKVYSLPLDELSTGEIASAVAVASINVQYATAMDVSADGGRAVVLTYLEAYEWTRQESETWAEAFGRTPYLMLMPPRPQGESICYAPDGQSLYLTSEAAPAPLWEVRTP